MFDVFALNPYESIHYHKEVNSVAEAKLVLSVWEECLTEDYDEMYVIDTSSGAKWSWLDFMDL